MIAGLLMTPLAGVATAVSVAAHYFQNEPYDPLKFVTDSGLQKESERMKAYQANNQTLNEAMHEVTDEEVQNVPTNWPNGSPKNDAPHDAPHDIGGRRRHAFHVTRQNRVQNPQTQADAYCDPPCTGHGWPVGQTTSTGKRGKRRRVPSHLLSGFGGQRVVAGAPRNSQRRARQRTNNFFKVREYGGLFRDPQGNVFRQFHNRTDFQPDREYLPNQAMRHNHTPFLKVQANTLVGDAQPRTNPMPRPHYDVSLMSDAVQRRKRDKARFQVQTVTDGLTPDGKNTEQNQQAPVGFIGGYDTTLFDSSINLGTTMGIESKNVGPVPTDFVEQHMGSGHVSTINTLEASERSSGMDTADAANYNAQTSAQYYTVGALDVAQQVSQPDPVINNAWQTYTTTMQRDPTTSALRLSPEFDAMSAEATSQRSQTTTTNNTVVRQNRQDYAVDAVSGAAGTGASVSQKALLQPVNDWQNSTATDLTDVFSVSNGMGAPQPLIQSTIEVSQRTNVPSNIVNPVMGHHFVGVGNTSDGDNMQRSALPSGQDSADGGLSRVLTGINRSDGDNGNRTNDLSTQFTYATLPSTNTVRQSQRF